MKKFIAMLLVAMMALSLVACGNDPAPTPDPEPTASTYKTGLGMVVSMSGTCLLYTSPSPRDRG